MRSHIQIAEPPTTLLGSLSVAVIATPLGGCFVDNTTVPFSSTSVTVTGDGRVGDVGPGPGQQGHHIGVVGVAVRGRLEIRRLREDSRHRRIDVEPQRAGGSSIVKRAASLPPRTQEMPSRSCCDDAVNVATRDQLFSAKFTEEGPSMSSSSMTLSNLTSRSAVTSLTPSLTCTLSS